MIRSAIFFGWMASFAIFPFDQAIADGEEQPSAVQTALVVPDVKQTHLEQYMTSYQAYRLISSQPEILFIDVREPTEILLFGHPPQIDAVVPVKVQSNIFNDELMQWDLVPNLHFLVDMDAVLDREGRSKDDMVIITCGSGMRSAIAANALIEAGYTNVWHIPDGYEGDDAPGYNTSNAWQIAGLPWSYDLVPGLERVLNVD